MNTEAARVFLPTLRDLESELSVPIPERIRILRELEFDLEALSDRFVSEGMPRDEARVRALETLVPDRIAIRALGVLHSPWYRRVTRHLSGERLRILERSTLALLTSGVLLVETLLLTRADLLRDPSPFLWPVLGMGAVLFAVIVAKVFQLWIKGDHRAPGRGLGGILVLAGSTLFVGVSGMLFDFYRLAGSLENAPHLTGTLASQWLVRDAALLSVSMLLALAGGLAWLVLTQWFVFVSGAHRDVLGLGGGRSSTHPLTKAMKS